jgi:hypothetical protein
LAHILIGEPVSTSVEYALETPDETDQTDGTFSWARPRENVTGSRHIRHKSDWTQGRAFL